jgi:hypothetical protein
MKTTTYDPDAIKRALTELGAHDVLKALGVRHMRGGPGGRVAKFSCLWHDEKTPSATLHVGPQGSLRAHCFGCGHTGDALDVVAAVLGLSVDLEFRAVLEEAARIAGVGPADPNAPRRKRRESTPEPPPNYPPEADLTALWGASVEVNAHEQAVRALETRGLSAGAVRDLGLATALPDGVALPRWAVVRGRSWVEAGYAVILPTWAASAGPGAQRLEARCVRAWHVGGKLPEGHPKRVAPAGFAASGLVLADPKARALLEAARPCRLVVVEGEPDFLSLATRAALAGADYGVLGVTSGAWTPGIAWLVPDGSQVAVCTHADDAGERYAEAVRSSASGRFEVLREPPRGHHESGRALDLNDMLLAGTLDDFNPFASVKAPPPPRAPAPEPEVDGIDALVTFLEDFKAGRGRSRPATTGFRDLDGLLSGGFRPGELWVVAGRTSQGKSSVALSMLAGHLLSPEAPGAVIYSAEMTVPEMTARLYSGHTGIPLARLRQPEPGTQEEIAAMSSAGAALSHQSWRLCDKRMTVEEIAHRARSFGATLAREGRRLGLVIVDYVQHLKDSNPRATKRESVMHICSELKALALEEKLCVLALAQVSREAEARGDKRPALCDLKESGSIEEDADGVIFVYRPHVYDPHASPSDAELIVRKHRNGPLGTIPALWRGDLAFFYDAQ